MMILLENVEYFVLDNQNYYFLTPLACILSCFKGIVHLEINFWYVLAYLKM